MEVTSWNLHHVSYQVELTLRKLPNGTYTMEVTSWNVHHGCYQVQLLFWNVPH